MRCSSISAPRASAPPTGHAGALFIPRNVLEWRCDPASAHRDERIPPGRRVVVMCDAGYQSSLAAATLRDLGVDATDLDGGFQAWRAAGLPLSTHDV